MTKENKLVLSTGNLFKLLRIVKKTNIVSEIKSNSGDFIDMDNGEMVMVLFATLLDGVGSAEQDIYELIADIEGKTAEDIEAQPFDETIEVLIKVFSDNKVTSFLSQQMA